MEFTIVIEKTPRNFSAYVPDLPGCVATGDTEEEVVREMRAAISFHLEGMIAQNEPIPAPLCSATVVNVAAVA